MGSNMKELRNAVATIENSASQTCPLDPPPLHILDLVKLISSLETVNPKTGVSVKREIQNEQW